ncbi:hypothetical protein BJY00DRAFT_101418 [Aspergillus carlsbadensis]|nr:hypothetical protein BJY00DRAFT_101418 [Aspergillus carlsbadensis]
MLKMRSNPSSGKARNILPLVFFAAKQLGTSLDAERPISPLALLFILVQKLPDFIYQVFIIGESPPARPSAYRYLDDSWGLIVDTTYCPGWPSRVSDGTAQPTSPKGCNAIHLLASDIS